MPLTRLWAHGLFIAVREAKDCHLNSLEPYAKYKLVESITEGKSENGYQGEIVSATRKL
jgi:hypothetical protein